MTHALEFSRPVKVETLPRDGLHQHIEANAEERAALARRCGLASIASLSAEIVIKRAGKGVRVTGALKGEVEQICVVSLDPFATSVEEEIDVRFGPPRAARRDKPPAEEVLLLDAEDDPDPIVDGMIDIGEVAAEFLALALDPYPRKPGVEFAPPEEEAPTGSAFGALARLKDDKS